MDDAMMLVVWTGALAGFLHVFAGADHLAALLPLSVGRHWRGAWLGARWGVGHSAGVLLIGAAAVALRHRIDIELVSGWGERLVGVMLIAIGLLGLRWAFRTRLHVHAHAHDGGPHTHLHVHGRDAHDPDAERGMRNAELNNNAERPIRDAEFTEQVPGPEFPVPNSEFRVPSSVPAHSHVRQHTAFLAGVLHGVAGTSHLLGVLPAAAMGTRSASAGYLAAFAAGTILAMAAFAAVVGVGSSRLGARTPAALRGIMLAASGVTIAVGAFWLVMPM